MTNTKNQTKQDGLYFGPVGNPSLLQGRWWLLELLPPVSWPDAPPKDPNLEQLYRIALALFRQWEARE